MDNIDFKGPENSDQKRRPFVVKVEEDVARGFIKTVQQNGLFVRETIVKLMREFTKRYGKEGTENDRSDRHDPSGN